MQENKIIVRYQSTFSAKTPVEAGRAEDVVRCVANLVQKGRVKSIFYYNSHALYKRGMGYTYEVSFIRAGRSRRRRFTVYKLSGQHAKSDCYQVTDPYGKYIVVKIPPQPITAIDAYLEAVVHERILAKKLSELGVKVVVPCVSSVMRHLHKFESADNMSSNELEDAYMELLRAPGCNGFAEYFKIGGSFVFFLEFLDEPFLGNIVREFYHKELLANIKKARVVRDVDLIRNREKHVYLSEYKNFWTKQAINEIFDGLVEAYGAFNDKIDSLSVQYFLQIDHAKRKDFFIANIVDDLIDVSSALTISSFDESKKWLLSNQLNNSIDLPTRNSPAFLRYLEILDQEVNWLAFKYSSGKIKPIGDNLLALLAKLAEMGLVLRDLKVDNLFVTDVENMELGVIDLETGGDVGSGNVERIVPAGMPGNMTVSNLLFISQLQSIYGINNVERILHIQDWYATVAMIFEAIVGRTLFEEARDYILKLFKKIDEIVANNHRDYLRSNPGVELSTNRIEQLFMLSDEEIKGHTWHFFALAKRDLKKKSFAYSSRLKEIKFCLPDALKSMILEAIETNLKRIQNDFRNFKLTDISGGYLDLSVIKMNVLQNNLLFKEQLHATFKANSSVVEDKLVELAADIASYKHCIALKQKENLLNKKKCILNQEQISAFALFPIMLDYIIEIMCREEWHGYRSKFTSGRHGMKSKQAIGAVAGWKATLVSTKEDYSPSLLLPIVANMNDDEKTLKNSFLLNYLQIQSGKF